MTADSGFEEELAAIRARRIQELVERQAAARAPPRGPVVLTSGSFSAFIAERPRVVVDVWAPWCAPCRAMAPLLDTLARELAGEVDFGKLNADEHPDVAQQWNVEGIPTLLLFEGGRLVDRIIGAQPLEALRRRLRTVFHPPAPGSEN